MAEQVNIRMMGYFAIEANGTVHEALMAKSRKGVRLILICRRGSPHSGTLLHALGEFQDRAAVRARNERRVSVEIAFGDPGLSGLPCCFPARQLFV